MPTSENENKLNDKTLSELRELYINADYAGVYELISSAPRHMLTYQPPADENENYLWVLSTQAEVDDKRYEISFQFFGTIKSGLYVDESRDPQLSISLVED